ncbi:MAG: class I SAM-dependent methyltransferase [Idiomarina sp.]|nr:class I SAM-dependent methyltransferase [Idiomarina sp.]
MKHWTQFWNTTATLSSFAEGDAAAGYDGELKSFWEQVFNRAPQSATVLDIGTGNGALAFLANQYSEAHGKGFEVHGSDAAKIDPAATFANQPEVAQALQKITFHSEAVNEKLPFEDESVDLVTSQFAFEYGQPRESLAEILRVLKPGGAAVLMLHHADSEIVKESQLGRDIIQYALGETPLFIQADLLLRIAHQFLENGSLEEWQKSQHCHATTKTTQWIMKELRNRYSEPQQRMWVDDVIGRVARMMQDLQKGETMQRLQGLAMQYEALAAHSMRLDDQLKAAYDKAAANNLLDMAQSMRAKASVEPYSLVVNAEQNDKKSLFAMKVVIGKAG